jgi:hypothetical protein
VLVAFGLTSFAMTQPEFQVSTRRGLFSLVLALALLAVLVWSGVSFDHLHLPPNT